MHEESSSAATDFALALDNNRRESRGLYVGIGFDRQRWEDVLRRSTKEAGCKCEYYSNIIKNEGQRNLNFPASDRNIE